MGYVGNGHTISGRNYFRAIVDGATRGIGSGACAAANCVQKTFAWLRDTLNENSTGTSGFGAVWDSNIWIMNTANSFPCLKDPKNAAQCLGGNQVQPVTPGTSQNPFWILTWEDMACVGRSGVTTDGESCTGKEGWNLSRSYQLYSNIDMGKTCVSTHTPNANGAALTVSCSGSGWNPIGTSSAKFTGTFDGAGYKIFNLHINRDSSDNIGLFGYTNNATLKNIGVETLKMAGRSQVGALVGNMNSGSISNSYATGNVTGGDNSLGGLVGEMTGGGSVSDSYATGNVTGASKIGGLVGTMTGSISNSYATGDVTLSGTGDFLGGLVGEMTGSSSLSNSYTTGNVYGGSSGSPGALLGSISAGTSITGRNYYMYTVYLNGMNGMNGADSNGVGSGPGTCASTICIQAMGSNTVSRRAWLQNTLNEGTTGASGMGTAWSPTIWGKLGESGSFPCLKIMRNSGATCE